MKCFIHYPTSQWDRFVEAIILARVEVGESWVGVVPIEIAQDGMLLFCHFDPYTDDYHLEGDFEYELPDNWLSWPVTVTFELAPGKYESKLRIGIETGSITIELLEANAVEHFKKVGEFEQ